MRSRPLPIVPSTVLTYMYHLPRNSHFAETWWLSASEKTPESVPQSTRMLELFDSDTSGAIVILLDVLSYFLAKKSKQLPQVSCDKFAFPRPFLIRIILERTERSPAQRPH